LQRKVCELKIQGLREFERLVAWLLIVFFAVSTAHCLVTQTAPAYVLEVEAAVNLCGLITGAFSLCLISSDNPSSIAWLVTLQTGFYTAYIVQQLHSIAVHVWLSASPLDSLLASSLTGLLYLSTVWLVAAFLVVKGRQLQRTLVELELLSPQMKL
jgi:hypothetical protein